MTNIQLRFNHDINESLQVGDDVYYCPNQSRGGFNTVDNENLPATGIVRMGECTIINRNLNVMDVLVNPNLSPADELLVASGLQLGDFIMFSKNNQANLNSLLGYYAETTFVNDSPKKAELFAVSTEFSESSK